MTYPAIEMIKKRKSVRTFDGRSLSTEQIHLFDVHRNPNDECIVGRHIRPTPAAMFGDIEATA